MSLNIVTPECPSSRDPEMSDSPATLERPLVPQLWNVRQSRNSGMSISPATPECQLVQNVLNVKATRIIVPRIVPVESRPQFLGRNSD